MLEQLVNELMQTLDTKDQRKINMAAQKLAKFLWKPEMDISYEELLEGLCYQKEEKTYGISKQK